jgi:hypothetical protein
MNRAADLYETPIRPLDRSSRIYMAFSPSSMGGYRRPRMGWREFMSSGREAGDRMVELQDRLRRAQVATPDLMAEIVAGACTRVAMPGWAAKAAKIHRLIELEAWTEATLALVELELPQWRLRRLVCEEGYWLCSLSKQWNLPAWLSDSAEACHESLPLAILSAMIEARQGAEPLPGPAVCSVPQCGTQSGPLAQVMCCDNFA